MINRKIDLMDDLLEAREQLHTCAEESFVLYEYRNELRSAVKDIDAILPFLMWHSDREKERAC